MRYTWTIALDELGAINASVIRCIAGELSDEALLRANRSPGVDVLHRMKDLVARHMDMTLERLRAHSLAHRHRIANGIVIAESEAGNTMPGASTPLRTREGA